MEMLILILILSAFGVVDSSCPTGFELVKDGECRGKIGHYSFFYDEAFDAAVANCSTIQGQIPVIHDDEDQSYYKNNEFYLVPLGLVCNTRSKRWEWIDGSALDYKPPSGGYQKELDEECQTGCVWYMSDSKWTRNCDHSSANFDVWCMTPVDKPASKDCDNFDNDTEDSVFFQIGATVENWQDAQIACRNYGANLASIHNPQENSFVRRLAVANGAVNGIFLGGTISGKGKDGFGWIDGTEWDYTNFFPGFPIDGMGDCLSMDTFGSSGQWMNMDCDSKLAVACVRNQNVSNPDVCSSGPWAEGQIIYTPGYPYDSSVPCDFFFTVEAGKKVEVKVHLLEANNCCDHLLLSDNYLGGNVVANLTGYLTGMTYTTKSSNLMRVSWNPNSGVNVRGAMKSLTVLVRISTGLFRRPGQEVARLRLNHSTSFGECRGRLVDSQQFWLYDEAANNLVEKCRGVDALPIIIHSEEDQSYWTSKNTYYMPIGLLCNTTSTRWEWADGSPVDYKPTDGGYDTELDQECVAGCVWMLNAAWGNPWVHRCGHDDYSTLDIWCWSEVIKVANEQCDNFEHDSESDACYQILDTPTDCTMHK